MKFRCERDLLVDALGTAGRAAISRGAAMPVLAGVRVTLQGSQLEVTGTDLELTVTVTVEVDGQADGVAVLPGRIASEVVRSLESGAVTVTVEGDEAHISAGRFQSSLRLLPADEYPRLPDPAEQAVTLLPADLADALRQVVPAASGDDARPILTGVLFAAEEGGLRLVATDSYRLAIRDLPGTSILRDDQTVLVPSRALREVERALGSATGLTLRLGEREATFEIEGGDAQRTTRITTRLIEGEFPNYRGLIPPSYPNQLTVGRDQLLDAVRRVKLMAREAIPVRLSMSADGVELIAITQDIGQASEQVDAGYEGTDLTVAFNPEYLLEGVDAAGGDEVVLHTTDAQKPAVLRGTDGSTFLYLLMPVRVS